MKKLFLLGSAIALIGAGCASTPATPSAPINTPEVPVVTTTPAVAPTSTSAAPVKTTVAPKTTVKKTTPVQPAHSTYTVIMVKNAFSPQVLAIKDGDTVVWKNNDTVSHTTASDGSLLWDSGNVAPGQSYRRVFASFGTYNYHSGSPNGMNGTIIVRQ